MFKPHTRYLSRAREAWQGISLRGPGFVIALTSFAAGIALSLPLANWLESTRYYIDSRCILALPVVLALGAALALAALGRWRVMIDVLATLLGLCLLSAVAVAITLISGV